MAKSTTPPASDNVSHAFKLVEVVAVDIEGRTHRFILTYPDALNLAEELASCVDCILDSP